MLDQYWCGLYPSFKFTHGKRNTATCSFLLSDITSNISVILPLKFSKRPVRRSGMYVETWTESFSAENRPLWFNHIHNNMQIWEVGCRNHRLDGPAHSGQNWFVAGEVHRTDGLSREEWAGWHLRFNSGKVTRGAARWHGLRNIL